MKLLNWISFGTWNNLPIMLDDYVFVKTMFIIFTVFVCIKVLTIFCLDCERLKKNGLAKWFALVIRLFHGAFYMLLFCILGLFHSPNLYWLVVPACIYMTITGIVIVFGDLRRDYIYEFNEKLKDLCEEASNKLHRRSEVKKKCKYLNKKIYDYRKTTVIG